jgi:prophage tail gpP-like protein
VRIRIEHDGRTVFCGIIDEYRISRAENGRRVSISGRGMGGVLLDNKCAGQEFISCTLKEILNRYVYPLGITDVESVGAPVVNGYSVETGDSCFSAISGFLDRALGTTPRFDWNGRLILSGCTGERYVLSENAAVKIETVGRRYGVVSQVDVMTARGYMTAVRNDRFIKSGGAAKRVITVPLNTSLHEMKYAGKRIIDESERERYVIEITAPQLFPVFPGDIIEADTPEIVPGAYHVAETVCSGGADGAGTKIILTKRVK